VEPFVPLLLILVLTGAGGWLLWHLERERRARYVAFAQERGWTYTPRDNTLVRQFRGEPFGRGSARRASHVLRGQYGGREAVVFDYRFVTRSSDGQQQTTQTHRFTVCALRLPAALPRLELTAENPLTRLAGALGFDDVELESEDFNRRYRVRSDDRRLAYDVLHARTIEQLLALPTLNLRLDGADAVLWERGTTSLPDVPARLAVLSQLVDGIPSYVWADRSEQGGAGSWS
jgi:hypothetical protein